MHVKETEGTTRSKNIYICQYERPRESGRFLAIQITNHTMKQSQHWPKTIGISWKIFEEV